jgi:hypothetical protein
MIEASLLDRVLERVAQAPMKLEFELASELRAAFPGTPFTVCGEDDIPPRLKEAAGNGICALYYIDANEHCLKLTTDAASASGIVVALRGEVE